MPDLKISEFTEVFTLSDTAEVALAEAGGNKKYWG